MQKPYPKIKNSLYKEPLNYCCFWYHFAQINMGKTSK